MTEIKSSYMIDFKPIRIEDKELINNDLFFGMWEPGLQSFVCELVHVAVLDQ